MPVEEQVTSCVFTADGLWLSKNKLNFDGKEAVKTEDPKTGIFDCWSASVQGIGTLVPT